VRKGLLFYLVLCRLNYSSAKVLLKSNEIFRTISAYASITIVHCAYYQDTVEYSSFVPMVGSDLSSQ
jgi:hypothetical protein